MKTFRIYNMNRYYKIIKVSVLFILFFILNETFYKFMRLNIYIIFGEN